MAPNCTYQFVDDFKVTDEMKHDYKEHGYILVRGMFDDEEVSKLRSALEHDEGVLKHSYTLSDGERLVETCQWQHPGSDITGMVARCHKVSQTMEDLLGDEVYHYHTKLMMKKAGTGGAFLWHQDYGYWYQNGCLYPDLMGSLFLSVDSSKKDNGCLQVLPGTHKCGRIEHKMKAGQTGAELERVEQLMKKHPLVYVEQEPGDALFFHCNLLHCSAPNTSNRRRWAFNVSFNTKKNDPVYKHHHPNFTPMKKVSNDSVKKCSNVTSLTGKDFLDPKTDKTVDVSAGKKEGSST